MPLVFAGTANHAPGITSRREAATPAQREVFFSAYAELRARLERARLDALVVVSSEHFTNFFFDNAPAFCIGLAEAYDGPSEDESFLRIAKTTVPGAADLARHLARAASAEIDLAHSQELLLDHGIMVPLHLLVPQMRLPIVPIIVNCLMPPLPPLARCYDLGCALRRAMDAREERIGLLAAGGLSHWPGTPESGRLNLEFDRGFLHDFLANNRQRLIRHSDEEISTSAGPGGHEIRAWIVASGATEGLIGEALCFEPIPAYAVTGCVATIAVV
ncbi:MAG: extradiol ring-cleavage dioxygenase [Betaproteobacteria bacterium]|nr:extradiol ring-cleavage dioxygenase [Betaproteobacteria bacterium]